MAETGRRRSQRAEVACFLVLFIGLQTITILFIENSDSLLEDFVAALVVGAIARTVTWLLFTAVRRRARS